MSLVKRWRTTALAWAVLSFWLLADLLVPNIMAYYFSGYDPQTVPTSTLMSPGSPVDVQYRIWTGVFGLGVIVLANLGPLYLHTASPRVGNILRVLLSGYGLGAIGMAAFTYDPMNPAANTTGLHSMAGYLGYTCLYLAVITLAILGLLLRRYWEAWVYGGCFVLALAAFMLLGASSHEAEQPLLQMIGAWQRLITVFSYLPFIAFGLLRMNDEPDELRLPPGEDEEPEPEEELEWPENPYSAS